MSDGKKIDSENKSAETKAVDGASGTTPPRPADPIEDVREGLGLLFRAAKGAVEKIPTKDLEKTVVEGVSEFGKMMGRFAETVGSEIGKKATEIVTPKVKPENAEKPSTPVDGITVKPADPPPDVGATSAETADSSVKSASSDLPKN